MFLTKLKEKGQSDAQRKQASMAIAFLYEISSTSKVNKSNTISDANSLPSNLDQAKDNGSSAQNLHNDYLIPEHVPPVKANISH